MAIKVIKRGIPPQEKKYNVVCRQCYSELEFVKSDAKYVGNQREGDYLCLICPVCQDSITKEI
jgi:hypothetical protein